MKRLVLISVLVCIVNALIAQDTTRHIITSQQRMVAKAYVVEGLKKYVAGDYLGARQNLANALNLNPTDTIAWEFYGLANMQLAQNAEALKDFSTVLRLDSTIEDAYYQRAIIKRKMTHYTDAFYDLSNVIAMDPGNADAYLVRGLVQIQTSNYPEAIDDFNNLMPIKPSYSNAYINNGQAFEKNLYYRSAVTEYTRAISLNPEAFLAYFYRGNAKVEWGNSGAVTEGNAQSDFFMGLDKSRITEINDLLYDEIAMYDIGSYSIAGKCFDKEVEQDPTCPEAYYYGGEISQAQKDTTGAMKNYNKAIELNPKYARAYVSRGQLKFSMGDRAGACADFEKAIKLGSATAKAAKNKYCY